MTNLGNLKESQIVERLENAYRLDPSPDDPEYPEVVRAQFGITGPPRPAAVLVPLLKQNNSWHILFTRRNAGLAEHSGQVAFPGGRADNNDENLKETALREAYEEIGLVPSDVRILGRMKPFITITNYLVTPIIGIMPWPYPLRLAVEEVTRAFTIPLEWLADPSNYGSQERQLPPPFDSIPVIYFQPYSGEVLWGASARFTVYLIGILKGDN